MKHHHLQTSFYEQQSLVFKWSCNRNDDDIRQYIDRCLLALLRHHLILDECLPSCSAQSVVIVIIIHQNYYWYSGIRLETCFLLTIKIIITLIFCSSSDFSVSYVERKTASHGRLFTSRLVGMNGPISDE